jgi:hypothetical protein
MKKQILEFIITGIYKWDEDQNAHFGEEIRLLEQNLIEIINGREEPVLEHILCLIYRHRTNKKLATEIRNLHLPLIIAYDKTITAGNRQTR